MRVLGETPERAHNGPTSVQHDRGVRFHDETSRKPSSPAPAQDGLTGLAADDARCGTGVVAVDTGLLDATAAALASPARPKGASGPGASAAGQGAADDAVGVDAFDAV